MNALRGGGWDAGGTDAEEIKSGSFWRSGGAICSPIGVLGTEYGFKVDGVGEVGGRLRRGAGEGALSPRKRCRIVSIRVIGGTFIDSRVGVGVFGEDVACVSGIEGRGPLGGGNGSADPGAVVPGPGDAGIGVRGLPLLRLRRWRNEGSSGRGGRLDEGGGMLGGDNDRRRRTRDSRNVVLCEGAELGNFGGESASGGALIGVGGRAVSGAGR